MHHLQSRQAPKTICPSEVARSFSRAELEQLGANEWRDLMDALRTLAFQLRAEGRVEVLQRGLLVPQSASSVEIKGPIRLRLPSDPD